MVVRLISILEKVSKGYKVIIQIDNQNIVAEWDGYKPEINRVYDVELDMDEYFVWGDNIFPSTESSNSVSQGVNHIKIVAKLDFNYEDNLASIKLNESIILIEVEGLQHDVSSEWVNLRCTKVKVYDTNL